jgi:hypothetical protein
MKGINVSNIHCPVFLALHYVEEVKVADVLEELAASFRVRVM